MNDKKLSFRLSGELYTQLLAYCAEHHCRPSAVIRAALLRFFWE